MTITLQAVNELIQSLESAGELSIKERKYLDLAKAYADKESESVAQALTFEKCRELSDCPAGVDLQDWVKQLAAENVRLAAENKMAVDAVTVFSNVTHDVTEIICDELGHDRVAEIVAAYNDLGNMPATDAFLDEARAQSFSELIDAFSKDVANTGLDDSSTVTIFECKEALKHVAQQLREGKSEGVKS